MTPTTPQKLPSTPQPALLTLVSAGKSASGVPNPRTTLTSIYGQCEWTGSCLEWQGRVQNGTPQMWDGERYVSVRRLVVEQERGFVIPKRLRCSMRCQNERCIADAHIALRSYHLIAQMAADAGKSKGAAARASLTRGRRARNDVKLSIEIAREVRASTLSSTKEAEKRGVSPALIRAIRRGDCWREAVPGASVFGWGRQA